MGLIQSSLVGSLLEDNIKLTTTTKTKTTTTDEDVGKSKSWKITPKIVIGILLGLLIVAFFIICYICIRKKKVVIVKNAEVTQENAEVTVRYSVDPSMNENLAMINSDMIFGEI